MTKFTIDKEGPAMPSGRPALYPLDELEVGHSFLVPCALDRNLRVLRQRVSNAAHMFGQRHGCRYAVRTVDGGIRVWRIE